MTTTTRDQRTMPLLATLGAATGLVALAIDMYLPAFGAIGASLDVDAGAMGLSLYVFLASLAAGQLAYGPLVDRFGRRGPLIGGLTLFFAASLLAGLASGMTIFLTARALQGLGAAAGLVVPRVIVADRHHGREAARAFSILMQVMLIAPVLAPLAGAALLDCSGWRGIFAALAVVGALTIGATIMLVPETLPPAARRRHSAGAVIGRFALLLGQRRFVLLALSVSATMAVLFSYIGASSFLFMDRFGVSTGQYSLLFGMNALGMLGTGQVNIALLKRYSEHHLFLVGLAMLAFASFTLTIIADGATLLPVAILLLVMVSSISLVIGNGAALVMRSSHDDPGSTSALFGVIQYVVSSIAGIIMSMTMHISPTVPPIVFAICALVALIGGWLGLRCPG